MCIRVIVCGVNRDPGARFSLLWINEDSPDEFTDDPESLANKPGLNYCRKLIASFIAQGLGVLAPGGVVAPIYISLLQVNKNNCLDSPAGAFYEALGILIQLFQRFGKPDFYCYQGVATRLLRENDNIGDCG